MEKMTVGLCAQADKDCDSMNAMKALSESSNHAYHMIPDHIWTVFERFPAVLASLSSMVAVVTMQSLDYTYTGWSLAGALLGTSMALAWHNRSDLRRRVIGRSLGALLAGVTIPPILEFCWPWIRDITANPILLFGLGAICAAIGFTMVHALHSALLRNERKLADRIANRIIDKSDSDFQKSDDVD